MHWQDADASLSSQPQEQHSQYSSSLLLLSASCSAVGWYSSSGSNGASLQLHSASDIPREHLPLQLHLQFPTGHKKSLQVMEGHISQGLGSQGSMSGLHDFRMPSSSRKISPCPRQRKTSCVAYRDPQLRGAVAHRNLSSTMALCTNEP